MTNIQIATLLPFEFLLPIIGILLIRNQSPIQGLIYRSFLGSTAALIYSLLGAPDVALTEVLVGTLLSTLLYIIAIKGCYSVIILVENDSVLNHSLENDLHLLFSELNFNIVFKQVNVIKKVGSGNVDWDNTNVLNGSPHAALIGNDLLVESPILREELLSTNTIKNLSINIINT